MTSTLSGNYLSPTRSLNSNDWRSKPLLDIKQQEFIKKQEFKRIEELK